MTSLVDAMQTLLLGAKVLSGIALLAVAAALIDLWRRPEVPSVSYGTILLSRRRLKALWTAFLVGALAVGSTNDPVLVRTDDLEDPALSGTSERRTVRSSLSLPLPFYHYERERQMVNGEVAEEHVLEGVVLPWAFIWTLLAYYLLVVRWNPDSRWARRVLEGRKRYFLTRRPSPVGLYQVISFVARRVRGIGGRTTIMGLGLAVVYLLADRNLAPCIVGHFLMTGAIEPGLMIAAVTGGWDRKLTPTMEAVGTRAG